ncbi:hypothetical protein AALO_G00255890 [Alosa alosa]|uniref:Uncharacterized protein n=1 Tax=Alosa alosa TaxID=278164 RepID=A0AAV6FSW3_9TELE|nr:hypothetical protein AALO_G00255890 [Alosa alosa]
MAPSVGMSPCRASCASRGLDCFGLLAKCRWHCPCGDVHLITLQFNMTENVEFFCTPPWDGCVRESPQGHQHKKSSKLPHTVLICNCNFNLQCFGHMTEIIIRQTLQIKVTIANEDSVRELASFFYNLT